jgi:hypothetical protein
MCLKTFMNAVGGKAEAFEFNCEIRGFGPFSLRNYLCSEFETFIEAAWLPLGI